jgi:hypothetical protein
MSDIDNITINYINSIDAIDVEYTNEIDTIVLSLGADAQSVFSVNGLTGNITLTAIATLPSVSASLGIYSYTINHNLQNSMPIISLYNLNNSLVISDLEVLNANSVKIKSVIDLNGYKVVVQK